MKYLRRRKMLKKVNLKPLLDIGMSKEAAYQLLVVMAPYIDQEFRQRVMKVFSNDDLDQINKEAEQKDLKPEDSLGWLEEKFKVKTGKLLMQQMREVFDDYVVRVAKMQQEITDKANQYSEADKGKRDEIESLLKQENWVRAAEKMDQLLKETGNG